jgi:SAM-dependent methyltransferase
LPSSRFVEAGGPKRCKTPHSIDEDTGRTRREPEQRSSRMDTTPLFHRPPVAFGADALEDPVKGLNMARMLFSRGRREMALDLYAQLVEAHLPLAVPLLADLHDRYQEITPATRYDLYQSRFFSFPIVPGHKVLDMGSGHMPFPLATHLCDITLTDGTVGRAGLPFKHLDGKPVYEASLENTPFADQEFDFVYCSHVLEHVDDPEAACRELTRIGRRGYIETPTKGKDMFMGTPRISHHRWHLEVFRGVLIFTEYEQRELAGLGVNLLIEMATGPQTDREKAFSALLYLHADQCNTMFTWEGDIPIEVRRL